MGDKTVVNQTATKIHLFWDSFTKADQGAHERGSWFDLFLSEGLLQLHDGKTPAEIASLTSNNVGSVLANEIVSDIKRICSQRCEDDDFGAIQNHFLCGRGWRSIALLHALGVQDVTCAVELTNLLTSIYGVEDGQTDNANPFVVQKPLPNIEQICKFRLPAKLKSRTFSISSGIEGSPPGPSRKISTSSYSKRERAQKQDRVKNTSDSEAVEPEPHRSHSLKIWLDPMDFDYFTSVVRSDDEQLKKNLSRQPSFLKKKNKKVIPDDFRDDRLSKVLKEEMSSYQFRVLIVEILQGLCQMDNPGNNVPTACFNFSLEQLCSLQFSAISNNSRQIDDLKCGMTRLFLCALDKVLLQPDATNAIVYKGALPIMLRLLEDGITKAQCNKKHSALLQDFIFGVTYAVINLIHSLLLQHHNPDKLSTFFPHFQQFVNSYNGRIIDKTVLCIVQYNNGDKVSLNRVRKIIGLLSQLILSFKLIRTKFVHLRNCKKPKHKGCRYPTISHHHDQVFGKVFANSLLPSSNLNEHSCAITALFMIFTRFLSEKMGREITIRTMQAMMQCGTCCCFPAPTLISRILKVIQQSDTKVRNLGLLLLEKTIYREVGAIDLVTMCQVCPNVEEKDKALTDLTKHRWACLEAFQDMLLLSNSKVAYTIGSHLMRVTPRCSIQVQREMFFGVFYPVFLITKNKYEQSKTEKDKMTTAMCLMAFTNLLGRVRFADEFLERNALQHILDLVKDKNFTEHCCLILEIIIIIRVWKLEKDNIKDILEENIYELKTLLDFVSDLSREFLKTITRNEASKKENSNEMLFENDADMDNYIKMVEKLGFFWKSWMNLCLYCPQIRAYCQRHLSICCHTLFSPFLQHIAKVIRKKEQGKGDLDEKVQLCNQLHLKLLESLIVLSVIAPYDGNPGGVLGLQSKLEQVVEGTLGLKQICDVLIRCSSANPSRRMMIPTHPMPKLDLAFGLSSALEDNNNSESSLENSADEGYDADIDLPCRKPPERENVTGKGSLPPSRRISSMHGERRCCLIAHPNLCHLVLHLIDTCFKKEKYLNDCVHSIYKISASVRDNPENSIKLSKSGFIQELLTRFSDLLVLDKNTNLEMQNAVLELFGHLAKFNINSEELASFLKLFVSENPPIKMILPSLLKLMSGTILQPKYILSFPADYSNANLVNVTAAHKLSISMHQNHLSTELQSCWSRSALFLPINAELGWSMWVQGFSISLWLRLEPVPPDSTETNDSYAESTGSESGRSTGLDEIDIHNLLHIISIGYEAHTLEFWADTTRELLHIRLTRPDGDKQEVLAEASLEGRISSNMWHHLAISVRDSVHNSRVVIEVTLIIDGWCEVQVPLTFKGILIRKTRSTNLLVGDTRVRTGDEPRVGRWQLGGLMMFRKPVLDKKAGIWLTAVGPDCYNMTQCRVGNVEPAWHSVFNPKTLTAGIPWEDLLDKKNIIKDLQESVLLSYCAKSPDVMNIYPMASATSSGLGGGFRVIGIEHRCSQLVPMLVPLVMYCQPILQNYCALTSTIDNLGGLSVFVVLFARVVELRGNEVEQAQALELFLRLSHSHPILKAESHNFLPLVRHVIESDICKPGPYMLKAILDTCCDQPGLIMVWADELHVAPKGDFLLTEPFVVTKLIIGPAKSWLATLPMFLQALLMLLRDDHPYREFNSNQLNRANALDALLDFCKDRRVEDHAKLDPTLCTSLVDVIRGLMTAPPTLHHLSALADYLLLAHASYISHSRGSLYFVLPPRPPSKTSKRNKKPTDLVDRLDVNEYRVYFTQSSADPVKLSKALTNLEIKQRNEKQLQKILSGEGTSKDNENGSESKTKDADGENQESDRYSNESANTYFSSNITLETDDNSPADNSSSSTDEDDRYIQSRTQSITNGEEGDDFITIGLLDLLRDQILVTPDSLAHTALPNVLIPESFIAMANHVNTNISTAVVKVLSAYLERANVDEKNRFIKFRGFHLLAMQLSYVTPTSDLADALAGIVTNTHWMAVNMLQIEGNAPFDFNLPGIPPLLSILPKSVIDIALCHNLIDFVHHFFIKVGDWKSVLEYGLVEALLKTLVCVMHQKYSFNDLGIPEHNIIVSDINMFLSSIAQFAIQTPGNNMQIYSDVVTQIEYVYGLENQSCGEGSECCLIVKQAQCSFLQSGLKCIFETVSLHTSKPSFLSSVISLSSDDNETTHSSSSSNSLYLLGKLTKSELNDRFKTVISKATELVVYSEPVIDEDVLRGEETRKVSEFVREVWIFILRALVTIIERKSMATRTTWSNVVWAGKETVRTLGSQVFTWLLSPSQGKNLKMFSIQSILNEPRAKDILVYIVNSAQLEKTVALFLWDLRYGSVDKNETDVRMCDDIICKIEEWCTGSVLGLMNGNITDKSSELVTDSFIEQRLVRITWHDQHIKQIHKVVYKHETLVKEIMERAVGVSKEVDAVQSQQMKLLLESIKAGFGAKVQAVFKWKEIVAHLTHERAIWHFPETYPHSWELDPTEGPSRVRVRLRRCHLRLDKKYFMEKFEPSSRMDENGPFSFIFKDALSTSTALIDRLHTNTKVRHMCKASVISPDHILPGELLIGHCSLYFVPSSDGNTMEWSFSQIKELHRRRFELQDRALELFLTNGKTYLLAYDTIKDRDDFMSVLYDCDLGDRVAVDQLSTAVQMWCEGQITNWQYLTILNTLSGRTYNDLMQYPVLPFILSDYTSNILDLTDIKSYRNLMKPMAIQEKKNEAHYINNYNCVKSGSTNPAINHDPYHYSSHYSNSGIVLHFLVRLPPFTKMFLNYQDKNFDCPDRTFHSLYTTWRLTSCESVTDVKELIPEFFFLPEFLRNSEGFNLGIRQSGEEVNDVGLPTWAKDARLFVLIHRQALESEIVREYLAHWIDLVFGYKQTGKEAVSCINVFHPATYPGFDTESIADPGLREAWKSMIRLYGQTPKQLFESAHPKVAKVFTSIPVPPPVIPSVKGIQWGHYVGSPGDSPPIVISQHHHYYPITSLVALLSNDVFGLAANSTLLLTYAKDAPTAAAIKGPSSVLGAALISWCHGDGILRAKLTKEQIPFPAVAASGNTILFCTSTPDCNQLWVAYLSGKINVYKYRFANMGKTLEFDDEPVTLVGHRSLIANLVISRAFSIAVSVSHDGSAIIWDINTLTYIRSLPAITTPVTLVSVSETLGDIATVGKVQGKKQGGSILRLHSINANLIGSLTTDDQITAITFSSAPEGVSVNIIATGMVDGVIRLWSTWDLTPVGVITTTVLSQPIICLTYSQDSQHLYASTGDGLVVIWQGSSLKPTAVIPRFLNLTSFP